MLPPSNSFLHQTLKLAEVNTNTRNQETLTPPPPPYSQTQGQGQTPQSRICNDPNSDAEDDENPWDTPSPSPITIKIDASINVHGNSNAVILASDRTSPKQAESESSKSTTMTVLQKAQSNRQTKLTEMTTAIISALHEARDYSPEDEGMYPAPVEININTGVKVKGSKNVICTGGGGGSGRLLSRTSAENGLRKRRAQSEPVDIPQAKRECPKK